MRYGLRFRPATSSPDTAVGVRMRPKGAAGTETKTLTVETPAPCASIFAAYSAAGGIDSKPGGGPNAALYVCGAAGSATITAHGIFCPDDAFDWEIVDHFGGVTATTHPAAVMDVGGNPTVDIAWAADPCSDATNNVTATLRRNGELWGGVFSISAPATGCADMATMPLGFTTYSPNGSSDIHFDIVALLPGYETLTPGDLTWHFTRVFSGDGDGVQPTITSDGPAISDGFTLHTDASLSAGGSLYGDGWQFTFSVGGVLNCGFASHYSDSMVLIFDSVNSPGVADAGDSEGPVLGTLWDNSYTVNHVDGSWTFLLFPSFPEVGADGNWAASWIRSTVADPDFDVSDSNGSINFGTVVNTGGAGGFRLDGVSIGGADPITIEVTVTSSDYGTALPRTYSALIIRSI